MRGKMIVIVPGALAKLVTELDKPPDLVTVQKAVGGYIEHVPYWQTYLDEDTGRRLPCIVYCNEHGKLDGMAYNPEATAQWLEACAADHGTRGTPGGDHLRGPVVILTGDEEFMRAQTEDPEEF